MTGRNGQRRRHWPYVILVAALAGMVATAAVVSFGWLPSGNEQSGSANGSGTPSGRTGDTRPGGDGPGQGDEPDDGPDRGSTGDRKVDGVLADPCSAVPKKTIASLVAADTRPVPNTGNQRERTCEWFTHHDGDPGHLHRIRLTLYGSVNVGPTFELVGNQIEGDGYEQVEIDPGRNDDALGWTYDRSGTSSAGVLITRGGTMGQVEVLGARLSSDQFGTPERDDPTKLLKIARTLAADLEVPDKATALHRLENEDALVRTVHPRPERPNACAVTNETLRELMDGTPRKVVGDEGFCSWAPTSNLDPGLFGQLQVSVHQMAGEPEGASIHGTTRQFSLAEGVEFTRIDLVEPLGRRYGEPGDANLFVGEQIPALGNVPDSGVAEVTTRVHDTTIRVTYVASVQTEDGERRPAATGVLKKHALAATKDLVDSMS